MKSAWATFNPALPEIERFERLEQAVDPSDYTETYYAYLEPSHAHDLEHTLGLEYSEDDGFELDAVGFNPNDHSKAEMQHLIMLHQSAIRRRNTFAMIQAEQELNRRVA